MALGSERVLAIPLIRTTKSGEPYRRPPDVEAQLEELLRASASEQLARVKTTAKDAPEYVKDECVVYLIRDAHLADDVERYHALVTLLLKRVTRGIERKLRVLGVADEDVDDVHGDVVLAMLTAILEGRRGEFYQVRFRRALRLQLVKSYDRYALRQRRAKLQDDLDAPPGGADDEGEDGAALEGRLGSGEDVATSTEHRLLIAEALGAIRDPGHREAFVLHYYRDWPIETIAAGEPSISQRFGRTPRMVRNWLRTAERQLAEWRAAKRL